MDFSGLTRFSNSSSAANATINHISGELTFTMNAKAGNATIVNSDELNFREDSTGGNATITNESGGVITLSEAADTLYTSTAGEANITNSGVVRFLGQSTGGQAQITNDATGLNNTDVIVDFSGSTGPGGGNELTVGSLAGDGVFYLGANKLTVGGNNLSTEVSGDISDCGENGTECEADDLSLETTGGSLIKDGTGELTLSGTNTFTGDLVVNNGTVTLEGGSAVGDTTKVAVDAGGTDTNGVETNGTLNVNDDETIGGLKDGANGGGTVNIADTKTLTLNNDEDTVFSGTIAGAGGLTKEGTSTQRLSGKNTYTGDTTINDGQLLFFDSGTAGPGTMTNNSRLSFGDDSTAGDAEINNNNMVTFKDDSSADNATINNLNGFLTFDEDSTAGNATITNDTEMNFRESAKAGTADITNRSSFGLLFDNDTNADAATITNESGGRIRFGSLANFTPSTSTAGNATITNSGRVNFYNNTTGGQAQITNDATGLNNTDVIVDFSGSTGPGGGNELTVGSLAGDGVFYLGANKLTVGGNNLSTEVSGDISDCGENGTECEADALPLETTGGRLVKEGDGELTLSGTNAFTGALVINNGTVVLQNGAAMADTGLVSVNANGELIVDADETIGSLEGAGNTVLNATLTTGDNETRTYSGALSGNGGLIKQGSGTLTLSGNNTYTGDTTINDGILAFDAMATAAPGTMTNNSIVNFIDESTADNATITNNATMTFVNGSKAGDANITNNASRFIGFYDDASAENATINNLGDMEFNGNSNADNATITNNARLDFLGMSTGGQAQITNDATGLNNTDVIVDFSGSTGPSGNNELSVGSLAGDGVFYLGENKLTVGGNGESTEVSGVISDCGTGSECNNSGATGGSLVKEGAGRMTLLGDNTYTGGTEILEGTVVLGSNTAVGTGAISMLGGATGYLDGVTNSNEIVIDSNTAQLEILTGTATQSGNISELNGPRPLEKIGDGTLVLSGTNTFTGPLTISAGTLALQGGAAVADSVATQVVSGAGLQVDTAETIGSLAGAGNTVLNADLTTGGNGDDTTIAGNISGAGGLIKEGSGTMTLSGTNTFTGDLAVNNGTVTLEDGSAVGDTTKVAVDRNRTVNLNDDETIGGLKDGANGGGTVNMGTNTLTLNNDEDTTFSGTIAGAGGLTKQRAATQTLSGVNTFTGPLSINEGTIVLQNGEAIDDDVATTVASGATLQVDTAETIGSLAGAGETELNANLTAGENNDDTTYSGVISGSGGLTKEGSGRMTLTGENTFTGDLAINAGTVALERGMAIEDNVATTVASGGVLEINAAETIGSLAGRGDTVLNADLIAGGNNETTEYDGDISGTGGFTKEGAGVLKLSGTNTFTRPLNINAGTLVVSNGSAVADTVPVSVAAAGVFRVDTAETIGSLAGNGETLLNANLTTGGNGDDTDYTGVISGTGGLIKEGTGIMTLSGANTFTGLTTVEAGTLIVDGSIAGPATVEDGTLVVDGSVASDVTVKGGRLEGIGRTGGLTVQGGVFAPGNSIGTMTVNGNFALTSGGVYEVEVDASGNSDKTIVFGTVNLASSSLNVLAETGSYNQSTEYIIIENDGTDAVAGTFASISTDLAFLTPSVIYDGDTGNDVVLTLERNDTMFTDVADDENEEAVAGALDETSTDDSLFNRILGLSAAGARQAFNALSGEIHASVTGTLADASRYAREAVMGRMVQAGHQGRALGRNGPQSTEYVASHEAAYDDAAYDDGAYRLGVADTAAEARAMRPAAQPVAFWTQGFGAWGSFEGDGNAATADRNLGGFISGMDAGLGGSWRVGVAGGASFSDVSVAERAGNATTQTYHAGGYVNGDLGGVVLRAGGLWAWSEIETSRAVVFPGFYEQQAADYDAETGQVFGEIATPVRMGRVELESFAGLAYVSVETGGFQEKGGAEASLRSAGIDQTVGYATVGFRAATTAMWGNVAVTPRIEAAWMHAFDEITPEASLAYATTGIGFDVAGVPLAEDSVLLDAGLDFSVTRRLSAGVSYSGQYADTVSDNAVKGRLTWSFN